MKKILKMFLLSALMISIATCSYSIEPDKYKPKIDIELASVLKNVVGVVQMVGTGVAVIASIWLGIRYVLSSVDEKADIKKKLIPFVMGAIIFYGATGILQLIADVATWFN